MGKNTNIRRNYREEVGFRLFSLKAHPGTLNDIIVSCIDRMLVYNYPQ